MGSSTQVPRRRQHIEMRTLALILLLSLLCGCYAQSSILKLSSILKGQRCRGRPCGPTAPVILPGRPLTPPAGQRCHRWDRKCWEMSGRNATCKYCPSDVPICTGFCDSRKKSCDGLQFRYQYQNGGGEQNTPRYGGFSSSCAKNCQIGREHSIQNGQGNTVPIVQIKVCADSFINQIAFTLNDGRNFTCGQSATGSCGTMKPNSAGQDYNFIYLEGQVWQFAGQEYFSNIVSSWIKG